MARGAMPMARRTAVSFIVVDLGVIVSSWVCCIVRWIEMGCRRERELFWWLNSSNTYGYLNEGLMTYVVDERTYP